MPGLHAQGLPADSEPAARSYGPLIWAAGGAGVLLVAGVVVLVFGPWKQPGAPAPDARVALAPAPVVVAEAHDNVVAQPALAQGELSPAQPGAIDPGARPIEPPLGRGGQPPVAYARSQVYPPPASTRPRETLADRAAAGRVASLDARPATPPAAVPEPSVEHYGAPVAAAPAPRADAIVKLNDLRPDVRAQLPRLSVGGSIYSDAAPARMVILNGQVFHEGDKPAADTVLEQIRPKSAVLNFRGQRYEVPF